MCYLSIITFYFVENLLEKEKINLKAYLGLLYHLLILIIFNFVGFKENGFSKRLPEILTKN